jgi:hypothetical protein
MMIRTALLLLTPLVVLGCSARAEPAPAGQPPAPVAGLETQPGQDGFWRNLTTHCGSAFRGRLTLEPPGDDMLTGTEELIVHFRECSSTEIRAPFHIEKEETGVWDRSRTWVFTRTSEGLELRHDHRRPDGTPDESTWYGGSTRAPGTALRQEFIYAERTAADGSPLGWRVEVVPGERYTYGTIRGGEWTWRVDFDLRKAVPVPPAPWGFQ